MSLTRKFLKDLLESAGVSDDSLEGTMTDILREHGASIRAYKDKADKYDDLDLESLNTSAGELRGIKEKLGSISLDDLLNEHNTFKDKLNGRKLEDVLTENEKYAEANLKRVKDEAISELIKEYKFTSAAAERDIRSQIAAMPMSDDGKSFKDAENIMKKLVKDNPDAFISNQKYPKFSSNVNSAVSNTSDEQSNFLMRRYGLTK